MVACHFGQTHRSAPTSQRCHHTTTIGSILHGLDADERQKNGIPIKIDFLSEKKGVWIKSRKSKKN